MACMFYYMASAELLFVAPLSGHYSYGVSLLKMQFVLPKTREKLWVPPAGIKSN